jgi:hypothetical protein
VSRNSPYETRPWDVCLCAWCTNPFDRTKAQAHTGVKYCSARCRSFGRTVAISDAQWAAMARKAHESRAAGRLARLAATVDGLTKEQAYIKGYQSGYSAGKAKRRSETLDAVRQTAQRGAA